jgi:hypothetical protein
MVIAAVGIAVFSGGPTWSQADPEVGAIQAVIQHAHQEQAQALASGDPSLMGDTATGAYLQQIVQVIQFLKSDGVTSIALTQLTWRPISVDGNTATATASESWHATFKDGTGADTLATNVYTLVQQDGNWLIEADRRVAGSPSTQPEPAPAPSAGQYTSDNWSGYVAVGGGTYTGVSGTWTVPQPVTSAAGGVGSTWVGIGGVTGADLIQAGTGESVALGRDRFQAWIETLPQVSQQVQIAVSPGDSVTVSIVEQGAGSGDWRVSISNNTTGQGYQSSVSYASSESSAEWIQEAPTGAAGDTYLGAGDLEHRRAWGLAISYAPALSDASARTPPPLFTHPVGRHEQ